MLILTLSEIRGGKNHMQVSRTGRHYPLKSWAAWRDRTVLDLRRQAKGQTFARDVRLRLTVYYWPPDRRRRDLAAMLDSLGHCLERAAILADDSQIAELHWIPSVVPSGITLRLQAIFSWGR